MQENLIKILSEEKILPIIRGNEPDFVINTAKALIDGGIKFEFIKLLKKSQNIFRFVQAELLLRCRLMLQFLSVQK